MQFLRDEGFIIRRKNLNDADRIVTIFTKESGKINVIAKGVRKITSRRSGLLEPLNRIKFQTVQSHSMKVLTEVELVDSLSETNKSENFQKIFIMCEIIDSLCGEDLTMRSIYEILLDFKFVDDSSLLNFKTDVLVNLGYWSNDKKFSSDEDSYRFIEGIIERKLKSRTVNI